MANQDSHGSNVPVEVDQKPMQPIPNRSELDINPNLSLGNRSGNYYPILPLQNPPPPPSSSSSSSPGRRGSATVLNGDKENADLIKHLHARRRREVRRKLSRKKRAREANKQVVLKDAKVGIFAMPLGAPKPLKLNPVNIDHDPEQTMITPFTGVVATLAGTQVEQLPKLNQGTIVAPPQTMVVPNTGGNGKAQVMYTSQSDHKPKSPCTMPRLTTGGGIPNGKKIEGVLVKSQEPGHNVLIVCLCHGHYLSPEEFVQHAGGLDLTNCMRHIKVEP